MRVDHADPLPSAAASGFSAGSGITHLTGRDCYRAFADSGFQDLSLIPTAAQWKTDLRGICRLADGGIDPDAWYGVDGHHVLQKEWIGQLFKKARLRDPTVAEINELLDKTPALPLWRYWHKSIGENGPELRNFHDMANQSIPNPGSFNNPDNLLDAIQNVYAQFNNTHGASADFDYTHVGKAARRFYEQEILNGTFPP